MHHAREEPHNEEHARPVLRLLKRLGPGPTTCPGETTRCPEAHMAGRSASRRARRRRRWTSPQRRPELESDRYFFREAGTVEGVDGKGV